MRKKFVLRKIMTPDHLKNNGRLIMLARLVNTRMDQDQNQNIPETVEDDSFDLF